MDSQQARSFAQQLVAGTLSVDQFAEQFARPKSVDTGDAQVDVDRKNRCGLPEVVFAEGKSIVALENIAQTLLEHHSDALLTRVSPEQAAALTPKFSGSDYNEVARTIRLNSAGEPATGVGPQQGRVCIVSAGTSDLPVAEEARVTAEWTGVTADLIYDVGVAGPHRLTDRLETLRGADAIVVVAGMEAALASVVGGHVGCPVIAVPTSVGYGASFGGVAALLAVLNSCAANVSVVNIDAGFKGGYVAGLIARRAAEAQCPK